MNVKRICKEINENILKISLVPEGIDRQSHSLIEPQPEFQGVCNVGLDTDKEVKVVANGRVIFTEKEFDFIPKEITRYTTEGQKPVVVTKKTVDGERTFVENAATVKVGDAFEAEIKFGIDADEAVYGLGQNEDGVLNYRNAKEYLYQNNMKIPMPVYLSSKNYAILFDCASMMIYEEKDNVITVSFDAVDTITYYVITGSCFDDLICGLRTLTGKAVMLPKWAFGYVQSKERYKTQEEILATVKEFKKRNLPIDCIVLDWSSWENGKWGNKILDKERFPDAKAMVDELHKEDVAFMVSIWPNPKEGCEDNNDFAEKGKLYCNLTTYDAFDEEAREIYWKQCERELFPAGTDAWWCDSTEPYTPDWNGVEKRPEEVRYEMAKESTNKFIDARVSNTYALAHAKGIYENQRKVCDHKRVTNLTRSGYIGSQKYGTITWSGDIAATWEVYRNQIAEGLSMCMSGIPYWTLDIGAFFVGNLNSWKRWANQKEGTQPWFWHGLFEDGVKDKGYCELYTRWLQYGTFLPIMRSHGTDTPREPWQFGEKGTVYYDTIEKYMKLRYRILPYTYSLAGQVWLSDYTIMRSLMFDYAYDEKVKEIADQFMYGPAFMVCPVTEAQEFGPDSTPLNKEQSRMVYLPQGADFYDYETKEYFTGGQEMKVETPISKMPLYVRAGAIIPVSDDVKGTWSEIEVYSGADGMFVYYDDQGNGYSYEKGDFVTVPIIWQEESKTLVVGNANDKWEDQKELMVTLYQPDGTKAEAKVTYEGKEIRVLL